MYIFYYVHPTDSLGKPWLASAVAVLAMVLAVVVVVATSCRACDMPAAVSHTGMGTYLRIGLGSCPHACLQHLGWGSYVGSGVVAPLPL